jgi:hypothetical protein
VSALIKRQDVEIVRLGREFSEKFVIPANMFREA